MTVQLKLDLCVSLCVRERERVLQGWGCQKGPDLAPSLSSRFMGQKRRRLRSLQASFFLSITPSLLFSWQQMKCSLKNSAFTTISHHHYALMQSESVSQPSKGEIQWLVLAEFHFVEFWHQYQTWNIVTTISQGVSEYTSDDDNPDI